MNGKQLIEYICEELKKLNVMLYDSSIVTYLHGMTEDELINLIKQSDERPL